MDFKDFDIFNKVNTFRLSKNVKFFSTSFLEMHDISDNFKKYYKINLKSQNKFESAKIVISLNPNIAPITVEVEINIILNSVIFKLDENTKCRVFIKELSISPIGFSLRGFEKDIKLEKSFMEVGFLLKNGEKESVNLDLRSFLDRNGASAGSVEIIDYDLLEKPLVTSLSFVKNQDGEIVIIGRFSEIMNSKKIEKVVINSKDYLNNI